MKRLFSTTRQLFPVALLAAGSLSICSASLVYDSSILVSSQGFGNVPRLLTVQATGNESTQSGCVGFVGGVFTVGPSGCIGDALVFDPTNSNTITNQGGQEASPLNDNQKFGAPTLASYSIASANQIGLVFNATEPGGNSITVTDLTLKFFDTNLNLLGAVELGGPQVFASSNPGNGVAGFVFKIDSAQQAVVAPWIAAGTRIAVESTMTNFAGGPESYALVKINPQGDTGDVPEPVSMALLGGGLAALTLLKRKRA